MNYESNKLEYALKLSDEILENIENEDISFEKILAKCKKLARIRNDFNAINWFILELNGYAENEIPMGITRPEVDRIAVQSGRAVFKKDPVTNKDTFSYWTASIAKLESEVETNMIALENLKPPEQYTPAIQKNSYHDMFGKPTSSEYVVEKYQDILNGVQKQNNTITQAITQNKSILSKIKNNVYNYVLRVNIQLRFENVTESIFQSTKERVDKIITDINPDIMKKFVSSYERLLSDNSEEWSQALSSCRNVLKDFADYVFPAQKEHYTMKDGTKLVVTDDKYKNRILAFIDKQSEGSKRRLLLARGGDLTSRVHIINELLSEGTHVGLDLVDAKICIIDTYLLIGSLVSIIEGLNKD